MGAPSFLARRRWLVDVVVLLLTVLAAAALGLVLEDALPLQAELGRSVPILDGHRWFVLGLACWHSP